MKQLALLVLFLLVASCSSSRLERKFDDANWDSLADESYLRWGDSRIKKSAGTEHAVINCYQGNSKAKETLETFKKDYAAKNQSPYYWLHIGNCYFVMDEWSKAEFYYRMSIEESKSKVVKSIALNNLGLIHFKYEQWEKGKELMSESLSLGPKFKIPRYNMSQLYLQFGLYDRAIEVLSGPAFRGHKDIDVFFSLANAYLYKGDLRMSSQYFQMIPPANFRREDIAATYALFLIRNGKIREAKKIMHDRDRSGVVELTAISQKIEKILDQRMKVVKD